MDDLVADDTAEEEEDEDDVMEMEEEGKGEGHAEEGNRNGGAEEGQREHDGIRTDNHPDRVSDAVLEQLLLGELCYICLHTLG